MLSSEQPITASDRFASLKLTSAKGGQAKDAPMESTCATPMDIGWEVAALMTAAAGTNNQPTHDQKISKKLHDDKRNDLTSVDDIGHVDNESSTKPPAGFTGAILNPPTSYRLVMFYDTNSTTDEQQHASVICLYI